MDVHSVASRPVCHQTTWVLLLLVHTVVFLRVQTLLSFSLSLYLSASVFVPLSLPVTLSLLDLSHLYLPSVSRTKSAYWTTSSLVITHNSPSEVHDSLYHVSNLHKKKTVPMALWQTKRRVSPLVD